MDHIKYHYEQTLTLLVIISSPVHIQLEAYGLGNVGEEMAMDLEFHFKDHGSHQIEGGFLTTKEAEAISKIDHFFEVRSGNDDEGFWSGLATHDDWKLLRTIAKDILVLMGKENLAVNINTENTIGWFSKKITHQRIEVKLVERQTTSSGDQRK